MLDVSGLIFLIDVSVTVRENVIGLFAGPALGFRAGGGPAVTDIWFAGNIVAAVTGLCIANIRLATNIVPDITRLCTSPCRGLPVAYIHLRHIAAVDAGRDAFVLGFIVEVVTTQVVAVAIADVDVDIAADIDLVAATPVDVATAG